MSPANRLSRSRRMEFPNFANTPIQLGTFVRGGHMRLSSLQEVLRGVSFLRTFAVSSSLKACEHDSQPRVCASVVFYLGFQDPRVRNVWAKGLIDHRPLRVGYPEVCAVSVCLLDTRAAAWQMRHALRR